MAAPQDQHINRVVFKFIKSLHAVDAVNIFHLQNLIGGYQDNSQDKNEAYHFDNCFVFFHDASALLKLEINELVYADFVCRAVEEYAAAKKEKNHCPTEPHILVLKQSIKLLPCFPVKRINNNEHDNRS